MLALMGAIVQERRRLRAEARRRQAEVMPKLREALRDKRARRSQRLKAARTRCAQDAARIRAEIAQARAALRAWSLETKGKAQKACRLLKANIQAEALEEIDAALREVEAQRAAIQQLQDRARQLKDRRGRAGGQRSAELRSEAYDEVRQSIGDDPVVLATFERVKGKLKPSRYRSLLETFLEYVKDHPGALQETTRQLEAQWAKEAERLMGRLAKVPPDDGLPDYLQELDEADRHLLRAPRDAAPATF